jgi:hypothetical protein
MKYTMVKQFYNAAIDNVFTFFFKIVDFGKIMIEAFWGLFDIFAAFFLIFYNLFMYVYYFFLFLIDTGSESGGATPYRIRRASKRSKIPAVQMDTSPNPIPAMYRVKTGTSDAGKAVASSVQSAASTASSVASSASNTISQTLKPLKPAPVGTGSKMSIKSIAKDSAEFLLDIFKTLKDFIIKPIKAIAEFLSTKLMPVKESDVKFNQAMQKRSLIDEYLKEYEKKQKKRR